MPRPVVVVRVVVVLVGVISSTMFHLLQKGRLTDFSKGGKIISSKLRRRGRSRDLILFFAMNVLIDNLEIGELINPYDITKREN